MSASMSTVGLAAPIGSARSGHGRAGRAAVAAKSLTVALIQGPRPRGISSGSAPDLLSGSARLSPPQWSFLGRYCLHQACRVDGVRWLDAPWRAGNRGERPTAISVSGTGTARARSDLSRTHVERDGQRVSRSKAAGVVGWRRRDRTLAEIDEQLVGCGSGAAASSRFGCGRQGPDSSRDHPSSGRDGE